MNKKSIIALFTVVALILGYVIGVFVGFPNVNSTLLSGDIGKANKHKQSTVNEKIKAVEEKLQNDSTYLQGTIMSLLFTSERISEFENLVELTTTIGGSQEKLQSFMGPLNEMKELSVNAQKSLGEALDAINKIISGEEANYENAVNHSAIAYQLVAKEIKSGKIIVEQLDKIIAETKGENNELAYIRDAWATFCSTEAIFFGDKMELAYWQDKTPILDAETAASIANQLNHNLGFSFIDDQFIPSMNLALLANGPWERKLITDSPFFLNKLKIITFIINNSDQANLRDHIVGEDRIIRNTKEEDMQIINDQEALNAIRLIISSKYCNYERNSLLGAEDHNVMLSKIIKIKIDDKMVDDATLNKYLIFDKISLVAMQDAIAFNNKMGLFLIFNSNFESPKLLEHSPILSER